MQYHWNHRKLNYKLIHSILHEIANNGSVRLDNSVMIKCTSIETQESGTISTVNLLERSIRSWFYIWSNREQRISPWLTKQIICVVSGFMMKGTAKALMLGCTALEAQAARHISIIHKCAGINLLGAYVGLIGSIGEELYWPQVNVFVASQCSQWLIKTIQVPFEPPVVSSHGAR